MKEAMRRPLGSNSLVSLFTLGSMRAASSQEAMYSVVKEAFQAGINHLETAPTYGPAESFLGSSIKRLEQEGMKPEGGWVITSKILPGAEIKEGQRQIKKILARLGKSKIDNLAVHGLNLQEHLNWAINGDGAELFKWAKQENMVNQIGFSSHGKTSLIKEALSSHFFQFCSLHLHLFDQERLPIAREALREGIGVMAISPADKGGRLYEPSQTLLNDCEPFHPLELAYRFLLAEGITTLTVGASKPSDLNLVKRLINSANPLNPLENEVIERLKSKAEKRLGENLCKQCKKCLPCPNNVPIPELLRLHNLAVGYELVTFAKERYNLIGRAGHWWEQLNSTACKKCGDCLPRCPEHLSIPDLLEETHKQLVDSPKRRLWG
ncbi:aldo/keto reductase [Prochlorococcus sp. MIT 1341]|uniref:aldo/keto reductase n=1 Tax=Prochlorococcus sp. MIT 1341 TaxID=3096221 RepID=UPI002A75E9E3|nr:aldo/keto reductase [Prochlorococcus sp. MIT 1341]